MKEATTTLRAEDRDAIFVKAQMSATQFTLAKRHFKARHFQTHPNQLVYAGIFDFE